ncbi:MAG: hypothetical protein K0S32_4384 [Bacteroidetes bacterium]|jgi:hypothetical protein|nr:hypothetical protein [Bacteroidota bacterium]
MSTIQDVKEFISDYTEWQFKIKLGLHDHAISYEEHKKNVDYLKEHFYPKYYQHTRTSGFYERFTDIETEVEAAKKIKKIVRRKVFLIRKYEGAVVGKGIVGLDNDTIFSCFIGQDNILMDEDVYMTNVIVGTIDNELRIITVRQLDSDEFLSNKKLTWMYSPRSFELEDDMVLKSEGQLVETLRVLEPGLPVWIEDYNS